MNTRLPDLPGLVRGIVACAPGTNGRNRYTLQCENCLETETPTSLIFMTFLFHTRGEDRRRMCKPCRLDVFKDCDCLACHEDRTGSCYR